MSARYAVILCGGSGTRLWPLSRSLRPKQLLALNGERTLLQQTAARLLKRVPASHLVTVTHQDHKFEVKGQLADLSPNSVPSVLAEPVARNTLPAIAWAAHQVAKDDPDAIIGVFPSDHAIGDEEAFLNAWKRAEETASQGYLTLIGLTPTEPAAGYGYIQPGRFLLSGARAVTRFVEKPDVERAAQFVQEGYLWNGGMFVFRASDFLSLLQQLQPEIYTAISSIDDAPDEAYQVMPSLSMDYGIAEKTEKVAVVPVEMGWSDLGSWDSIYQHQSKEEADNVWHGDVLAMDTHGSLLWTTHGLLATLGVNNLAIIQTADATLVCDRSRAEEIKQVVAEVQKTHPHLMETHLTVHRPWGTYTVLEEGSNFKIKRIVVNPGASLSMQMHQHRSEHWVVVSGVAKITNGESEILLHENESTYIPKTHRHRLENPGNVPLQIIEVQCGNYVGEDDIVRFEDIYGRPINL
jgi:mannose-1-phosphate guanylyltransferase/mannose-6-phosphate isomerase